jgi:hypothetical protein
MQIQVTGDCFVFMCAMRFCTLKFPAPDHCSFAGLVRERDIILYVEMKVAAAG